MDLEFHNVINIDEIREKNNARYLSSIYLRQNILKYSSAIENGEFLVGPTLLLIIIFLEQNGADILITFERLSTNYPVAT